MADRSARDSRKALAGRVLSVPPGQDFLHLLSHHLLQGTFQSDGVATKQAALADPLALMRARIYLPTRRAARGLADALVRAVAPSAVLLPDIRPIGEADEDMLIAEPDQIAGYEKDAASAIPAAIPQLDRLMLMSRLVLGWAKQLDKQASLYQDRRILIPASPADAIALAGDLLALMDQMDLEQVSWEGLQTLVPEDYADYWQVTLAFLSLAVEVWPGILAERGCLDPVARRNALIMADAAHMLAHPPQGPVILAGTTGSVPAIAHLMKTIASLPNGVIILPGLDRYMDERSWAGLLGSDSEPAQISHPQYGFAYALHHLGLTRADVADLGSPNPTLASRTALISDIMRPVETTDQWAKTRQNHGETEIAEAFSHVALVHAASEQDEALSLACALRESLDAGKTAALVTPDRGLARRVASELKRWQINVDDSAGLVLSKTPPGILMRLITDYTLGGFEPVALLSLIKHPLACFGLSGPQARTGARTLELGMIRGPLPAPGVQGLAEAFANARAHHTADDAHHRHPAIARLRGADWDLAAHVLERLTLALEPLETMLASEAPLPITDYLRAHMQALMALSVDEKAHLPVFDKEAGETLHLFLQRLQEADYAGMTIAPADYGEVFSLLMAGQAVRSGFRADSRVHILGLVEARLIAVDRMILGGLNEGTWPGQTRADPWLSRAMRTQLGLEPPERRIGLAAHDFTQCLGAGEVILSRAEKQGGVPTVAARWLQRLTAYLGTRQTGHVLARGQIWRDHARMLNTAGPARACPRPDPKPPVARRPHQLSITEIEDLVRDPYIIYARHVLALRPLEAIGVPPNGALKGSILHDCLATFLDNHQGPFDEAARARLEAIGQDAFKVVAAYPDVYRVWWQRYQRIADWFIAEEGERASRVAAYHCEVSGHLERPIIDEVGKPFRLRGRADRIDILHDGQAAILDYKTGETPSNNQIETGLAPQLALEVAMQQQGAFDGVAASPVSELAYIKLSGNQEAGLWSWRGRPDRLNKERSPDQLGALALARLDRLIAAYRKQERGYTSRIRPMFERAYPSPYDHLARVKEWASGENGEEEA